MTVRRHSRSDGLTNTTSSYFRAQPGVRGRHRHRRVPPDRRPGRMTGVPQQPFEPVPRGGTWRSSSTRRSRRSTATSQTRGASSTGPSPIQEVHAAVNDLLRPIGTQLYGRRLYEVIDRMGAPRPPPTSPRSTEDFAQIWRAADKIVYSTDAQHTMSSARTRIERVFRRPPTSPELKASADRDLMIGGARVGGAWRWPPGPGRRGPPLPLPGRGRRRALPPLSRRPRTRSRAARGAAVRGRRRVPALRRLTGLVGAAQRRDADVEGGFEVRRAAGGHHDQHAALDPCQRREGTSTRPHCRSTAAGRRPERASPQIATSRVRWVSTQPWCAGRGDVRAGLSAAMRAAGNRPPRPPGGWRTRLRRPCACRTASRARGTASTRRCP